MMNISVHGHTSVSYYTFTENGKFREMFATHGAHLLALAIKSQSIQSIMGDSIEGASVHLDKSEDDEEIIKKSRRNYYGMRPFEWAGNRTYYISRFLGTRDGEIGDVYSFPPPKPDEPYDLIVWDDGLGGLQIDEKCRMALWASNKALPDRVQYEKIARKCHLFIDADVLRLSGAMISRQVSWERSVTELLWQIQNNPAISYLMQSPHVVIPFAEDGAVYIDNTGAQPNVFLSLTHGGAEGSLREKMPGSSESTFLCMTLFLATSFITFNNEKKYSDFIKVLGAGQIVSGGYKFGEAENEVNLAGGDDTNIIVWPSFPVPLHPEETWTIADSVGDKELHETAFDYVHVGSAAIEGLPQLKFGAFTTVDRYEIEAFQNIRSLILGYAKGESTRPLSIAVFGSPGSGKSFGVTQIAQNILPGKVEKLEFNVSQFTSLDDLGYAFQKVRDTILHGKLPLVFFDEFDSDRDGLALGWVKSFLMPMQDGKFKDASGEHPLGKCILVFAGGTAASFDGFVKDDASFKNIKGPDFVSRLRGTINVLGPNQRDDKDKNYILRRALLLRSLCLRKLAFTDGIAPVNENIIRAMLHIDRYKHGARSMEAILDMSSIEGGTWEPVSLPSHSQLSLHVDADAFTKLVLAQV